MNKISAYHRVKSNMRYFNNTSSSNSNQKYMDMSEEKKIKRMKFDMSASKITMLMYVLGCGGLVLAYIIYIIFGDVDMYYIEDTLPGVIGSAFVALLSLWLFKSNNSRMHKKHKELFGFSLEESNPRIKRNQSEIKKNNPEEGSIRANQDRGEIMWKD